MPRLRGIKTVLIFLKVMENIKPISYKIRLEPDLRHFSFSGSAEILLSVKTPVDKVVLNILDLAIWSCNVTRDEKDVSCPFHVLPEKEELTIFLPIEMKGEMALRINYVGRINDKMAGFYRSQYPVAGEDRYIAVTQFEESDARRAFPCFDHPKKKASFNIVLVVDDNMKAISNCPVMKEEQREPGKTLLKFKETPRMSTYLLFFGVGDFEFIDDPGKVLIRVVTVPGMKKYAQFGLQFGRDSLTYCENYFGIEYPLPKLDLIAVPDFAFGAMENWGAITFRENLLLHYPKITSKAGEERICEVIAHEIVHQWFGNLVTPSEWKYLWLNESFATYFAYGVVDHYHPEWDIWEQFIHSQTDTALNRDALLETFPIEIPGGEHVVINSSTAPIIYNKGGSILRQIKEYMGPESFKAGLRSYLKRHEYDCASSHHLWESFEEVSEKPISKIMRSWIEQKGFPIVEVKREGPTLHLRQKRFSYLPAESDQEWFIPVTIRLFYGNDHSKTINRLLREKQEEIDIGSNVVAYKVNDRQSGFFRVRYMDRENFKELGRLISNNGFQSEDRWGLQNDLYAMVKAGNTTINEYLDFLSYYAQEGAYLPLTSISDNLFHAYLVFEGDTRKEIEHIGRSLLGKVLEDMGYEPDPGEKHTKSILRDKIIFHLSLYGSKNAELFAHDKFALIMKGESVHPDIIKSAMLVGALNGDEEVFDWFDIRLRSSESEHERMNIIMALGCFKEPSLIERSQQYILERVPDRNRFAALSSMAVNPHAVPLMWDWFKDTQDQLEQFHPVHYERVLASIIPICCLGKEREAKSFFDNYMAQTEKAGDTIRFSLERLEINSRMRRSTNSS